jgi:hypothetical protein
MSLTSTDPEPAYGTVVRDAEGRVWRRGYDDSRRCWAPLDEDGWPSNDDPESWVRVAGNHGPVEILRVDPVGRFNAEDVVAQAVADPIGTMLNDIEEQVVEAWVELVGPLTNAQACESARTIAERFLREAESLDGEPDAPR